ncbi:MAG TPA: TIGR03435 family protein, partial [Bryobacteraceae bacterium]
VKKSALAAAGIVCLALPVAVGVWGSAAHAQSATQQSLAGTWQGTLRAGSRNPARIVIKISNEKGGWKALMYNIDLGSAGNPSSVAAVEDSNVKITFPATGATFQGKLSGDGNSLTGIWTRLETVPLTLVRATAETGWAIPEPTSPPTPMAADANPAFEVATIKQSRPDDRRSPTIQIQYRRLLTWNKSVMNLITFAYSINQREVVNGPDWLDTKYDIVAQPGGEGQPSLHQWQIMIQKLLAERFRLSYHREKKEVSIYALVVANNGPKLLAPSTGDPKGLPNLALPARGRFRARNATMLDFVGELQGWQNRPVVDRTGIPGRYDFGLNWTPDDYQASLLNGSPAPRDSNEAPDLFTALQEQLGLRLESSKGFIDALIIDHVERPSEN